MGRAARKIQRETPRKRHIKEAPKLKNSAGDVVKVTAASFLAFMAGIFILLALVSHFNQLPGLNGKISYNLMGTVGLEITQILSKYFGYCSFVLAAWVLGLGVKFTHVYDDDPPTFKLAWLTPIVASIVLMMSAATVSALFFTEGGGLLGEKLAVVGQRYLNWTGTFLFAVTAFIVALGSMVEGGVDTVVAWLKKFGIVSSKIAFSGFDVGKRASTKVLYEGSRRLVEAVHTKIDHRPGLPLLETTAQQLAADDLRYDGPSEWGYPELDHIRLLEAVEVTNEDYEPDKDKVDEEVDEEIEEEPRPKLSSSLKKLLKSRKKTKRPFKPPGKRADGKTFKLPPSSLLVSGETDAIVKPEYDSLVKNSKRVEVALENFKVKGRIIEVHPGPIITLYEFEPAPGVKVQRVISLADDLALALKVASVRVYAPVPGKGTVGIEVPNEKREIVRLRDLIETKEYNDPDNALTLALGKDTFGDPYMADLAKMPHLLIAGATGTGKSVCINSLLLSLLCRMTPEELRLILIDPKMLELSVYEGIPHLKAPVVTQAKKARGALWWAVEEMERRYELMKNIGVRNLAGYNAFVKARTDEQSRKRESAEVIELDKSRVVSVGTDDQLPDRDASEEVFREIETAGEGNISDYEALPRIVIVVDELADLMLTVGREVEELLTRLAQKARAAGIHLILATQRPSVNVITGLIKANFPSRISFKVASRIDARTVLDTSGSERLLGQGDMLFLQPGAGRPKRLHSPFVSDNEVHVIADWLRKQGEPDYDASIERMIQQLDAAEGGGDGSGDPGEETEYDSLYDQALHLVAEKGLASTSMIQRAFRIGYNRAARILETMEKEGVVGPADGAKPRPVLAPRQ
jgi:S-DNA-T family DNA segregation ATPase FtsK/SpoIIIE